MNEKMKAVPNGWCWCDCGEEAGPGAFFVPGHDKRAERYLAELEETKSIADRLAEKRYRPNDPTARSLRDEALALKSGYEVCGLQNRVGADCRVIGKGAGIRKHRASKDKHRTV